MLLCPVLATIIFWAFVVWIAVQCGYALFFFARILFPPKKYPPPPEERERPVSVIICAKNEAANLQEKLPLILSQAYATIGGKPAFEVVLVDDCSTDDTPAILAKLQQRYAHLKVVTVPPLADRKFKGKKFALSVGLSHASNDWLLLTDADCTPASPQWLRLMVAPLAMGKEIVAGHGAYNRSPGWLNVFVRCEAMHSFLQMSTYAQAGKPYMASGRNIACTRSILQKAQQAEVWNLSPSGDDDLIVNTFGTAANYAVVSNPDAFTYTDAEPTLKKWAQQKQRHLTDGKSYRADIKTLLALYGITHAASWLYCLVLLFTDYRETAVCLLAIRCTVYWPLWAVTAVRLKEKGIILLLPLFDIGWMIYNFAFLPYILLKNKQHWK